MRSTRSRYCCRRPEWRSTKSFLVRCAALPRGPSGPRRAPTGGSRAKTLLSAFGLFFGVKSSGGPLVVARRSRASAPTAPASTSLPSVFARAPGPSGRALPGAAGAAPFRRGRPRYHRRLPPQCRPRPPSPRSGAGSAADRSCCWCRPNLPGRHYFRRRQHQRCRRRPSLQFRCAADIRPFSTSGNGR